jgi:hypothetical protein
MSMRRVILVLALAGSALAGAGVPARAQSPSGAPSPSVEGEVSGGLEPGGVLSIRADVTMPGGWQGLHLVEVAVFSGGRELEHLAYEVESSRLEIGSSRLLVGTGSEGSGTFLRVRGPRVVVTTGGPYLSITIDADVLRTVPAGARFRLSATSDTGATAEVMRTIAAPADEGGFGWDVVFAAIAGALLVGAFAGNLVASRRRPPPRLSVYGAIQRRLDAEPPVSDR